MIFIIDIIKGIFMGVANIIPGVSGGTMAVSMGVYDKMINAITNILKEFKKSFFTLLPLAIGMIGGIGLFSFIIPHCLTNYAFPTCMCFTGLIVGGIPQIIENAGKGLKKEKKKVNPVHIVAFLITLGVAVWMAVANGNDSGSTSLRTDFVGLLLLAVIGIVAAATMVIPGVSGSLVLMILGYYAGIMNSISGFISALKNFDWSALGHHILILAPFGIGCVLGIVLISKLISWLLKKFESVTYCAILGLIVASPFALLYNMEKDTFTVSTILLGAGLFIGATTFTYLFSKKTK